MKLNLKTKNILIFAAVTGFITICASFYFTDYRAFVILPLGEKPKVIRPTTGYEKGTTINLYKKTPPGFPGTVILENQPLTHSTIVKAPDGKKVATVAYNSKTNWQAAANMYAQSLVSKDWEIKSQTIDERKNTAVLEAVQYQKTLVITFSQINRQNSPEYTLITFQYEF